ncbi:Uncharacterised protein [Mycolicibacterium gilvum]|uniref:Uncharacterized protein n=1 Tax=Mycolicibacterium gilvum TaxID=1804 RepID=A0A379MPS2_9MYCO|nr:Uncharacterised protein [Mycolicibacterium gilvum]
MRKPGGTRAAQPPGVPLLGSAQSAARAVEEGRVHPVPVDLHAPEQELMTGAETRAGKDLIRMYAAIVPFGTVTKVCAC